MNDSNIELREYSYGWTVTVFDQDGHAKHLTSADSEIEAYRTARRVAGDYRLTGTARVVSRRGEYFIDLATSDATE